MLSNGNTTTIFGGNIAFAGANIDIEGNIVAPDGNLSFTVTDFTPYQQLIVATPPPNPSRGVFHARRGGFAEHGRVGRG